MSFIDCQAKQIFGRGYGVVATKKLDAGTILLQKEKPIQSFQSNKNSNKAYLNLMLMLKILSSEESLTNATQLFPANDPKNEWFTIKNDIVKSAHEIIISWHKEQNFDGRPKRSIAEYKKLAASVCGVIFLNGFLLNDSENNGIQPERTLLFLNASRFNHDCWPNCCFEIDLETNEMTIRTISAVEEGTELCISYTDLYQPTNQRQTHLQQSHFFKCTCLRCSLPDFRANDQSMLELSKQITDKQQQSTISGALQQTFQKITTELTDLVTKSQYSKRASSYLSEQLKTISKLSSPRHFVHLQTQLLLANSYWFQHLNFENSNSDEKTQRKERISIRLLAIEQFNSIQEPLTAILPSFWPIKTQVLKKMISLYEHLISDLKLEQTENATTTTADEKIASLEKEKNMSIIKLKILQKVLG